MSNTHSVGTEFAGSVYEKLLDGALADFERFNSSQKLTDALHARLLNDEDKTDIDAWEVGLDDVLANNDAVFRNGLS